MVATQADLDAQHDLLLRIHRQVDRTTTAINRMRDLRAQLDGWAEANPRPGRKCRGSDCRRVPARRRARDRKDTARRGPSLRLGAFNYGVRLLGKLTALSADVSLGDYRPTDVTEEVFSDLQTRIDQQVASFERLVAADLPAFNARLAEAKLDAVSVTGASMSSGHVARPSRLSSVLGARDGPIAVTPSNHLEAMRGRLQLSRKLIPAR